MNTVLLIAGSVFAGAAAAVHVYFFYLESIAWSKERTWKRFGFRTQAEADTAKPLAFNQGYYNAFLAVGIVVGLVLVATPEVRQAGLALVLFSAASMLLASLVLIMTSRRLVRIAAIQGGPPLIGGALLLLSSVV